ncbi:hypothetical protein M569_05780, partial [Genlisea aurea]
FHELMLKTPHEIPKANPAKLYNCHLHEGSYGTNGSVIEWEYFLDGKVRWDKQILQDIDEEKKHIGFKMIGGELLELYKEVFISNDVETKDGVDFITWTIEYELLEPDNPHPLSLLNYFIEFTKDIEAYVTKEE